MKDQDAQMFAYASWLTKHGGFAKDMTMRDHFAAKAMQALLTRISMSGEEQAKEAYRIADAMLKTRGDK